MGTRRLTSAGRARGRAVADAWKWVYSDPRWALLRGQVLSEEPACACGCGQPSTVVDHIRAHRGDPLLAFDRTNLQGMARRCHDRKTAAEVLGAGDRPAGPATSTVPVTLVCGPPCAGKTTYVGRHAEPGDLVVDWDALAGALGSPRTHEHPPALRPFVAAARDAVVDRLARPTDIGRAWIIATAPTEAERSRWPADEVVILATAEDVCARRARAAGRAADTLDAIADWWRARHADEHIPF
ncbi:AAA family ATPase [Actinocatenispora sera]|uniref:AAA family ATPase n=1 Tax=Actinocatenispora sera TaxID=390989 RepID=UPI0033C8D742